MPQHLICMKGHPGTGKSTLARVLARDLAWPLIDKDDIKDHTWPLANGNSLSYDILWQMVETQLNLGLSVIVDSPFSRQSLYDRARQIAHRFNVYLLVVQTELDEEQWQQRLEKRSRRPSPHKPSNWAAMQAQLKVYQDSWRYTIDPQHLLVLNTGQRMDELVQLVRERLGLESRRC